MSGKGVRSGKRWRKREKLQEFTKQKLSSTNPGQSRRKRRQKIQGELRYRTMRKFKATEDRRTRQPRYRTHCFHEQSRSNHPRPTRYPKSSSQSSRPVHCQLPMTRTFLLACLSVPVDGRAIATFLTRSTVVSNGDLVFTPFATN